jgi:F-type H+-transporting ATPase subunit b
MRPTAPGEGEDDVSHLLHLPHGLDDPTFWVLLALILFLGLVVYLKVPGMLTKALDARGAAIAKELEEAKRLREEAQELLASFQRRQREAESEAEAIIAQAHRDAERFGEEARAKTAEMLERRAELAERKIAQAEADAAAAVRAQAAELAVAAAERLLKDGLDAKAHGDLVDAGVEELKARFRADARS